VELEFRRLGSNDFPLLQHVDAEIFDFEVKEEFARRFLSDDRNILIVARASGRIIGQLVAIVHQHLDAPNDLFIENLGVAEAWRRHGVARRLLEMAFEAGVAQRAVAAWVATEEDNGPATGLYQSTGASYGRFVMFSYSSLDLENASGPR
jgi:aminoglycoside 6'-N-acetyltransferase I